MTTFTRPDASATCDPRQLAQLLGVEAVDIDQERVIVKGTPPANAQDIINAYVYDPYFGEPAERTRVRTAYSTLKQWAVDAEATYDAATTATRGLTAGEQREVVRRLGIFFDRFADLLVVHGLD